MSASAELNSQYTQVYRGQLRSHLWVVKRDVAICLLLLLSGELYLRPRGFRRSASLISSVSCGLLFLGLKEVFKEVKERAHDTVVQLWDGVEYTGELGDLAAGARAAVEAVQMEKWLPARSDGERRFFVALWFVCPEEDRAALTKRKVTANQLERCLALYGEGDQLSVPTRVICSLLKTYGWEWNAPGKSYDGRRAVIAVELAKVCKGELLEKGTPVSPTELDESWLRKMSASDLKDGLRFLLAFGTYSKSVAD